MFLPPRLFALARPTVASALLLAVGACRDSATNSGRDGQGGTATPVLVDARDCRPIRPVEVLSHDGRVLHKGDLHWALPEDVARDEEPEVKAAE